MTDCLPDVTGLYCTACGWRKPAQIQGWPHRNCPGGNGQSKIRPGTRLHELLWARYGVDYTASCGCRKWVMLMDEWGPEGCKQHIAKIVNHMLKEAKERNWQLNGRPLLSVIARVGALTPVGRACARLWAKRLVLEACEL